LSVVRGRGAPTAMFEVEGVTASPEMVEGLRKIECTCCARIFGSNQHPIVFVPIRLACGGDVGMLGLCADHAPLLPQFLDPGLRAVRGGESRVGRAALPMTDFSAKLEGPAALRLVKCAWCHNESHLTRQADLFTPVTESFDATPLRSGEEVLLVGLCFPHGFEKFQE
jgi:hypothetical protein